MDDILELRQAFDDAELHADTSRLDSLLADDFVSIGEQGYQLNKWQWIGGHADFRYLSIETAEIDVRCYDLWVRPSAISCRNRRGRGCVCDRSG